MVVEQDLILALEFLTEGKRAVVPEAMARRAFTTKSFQKETQKVQEKARGWTMGRGIQGVGIGQKTTQGKATEDLALRIYVGKKKARAKVKNPVPKSVQVPEVGKIGTDVVEIGRIELETFSNRVRPAMPGSGIGHRDVSVGTFGCLVRRRGRRRLYVLSNSHVLANSGLARTGDPILQPGRKDGGLIRRDRIGSLKAFVPFDFGPGFPNLVDAAIARVRKRSVEAEIRILGVRPKGVSTEVQRDMLVRKVGRTTDLTIGQVSDIHFRTRVSYKKTAKRRAPAGLRDLVLCSRYTQGGDSGSLVLNDLDEAVGLHFAGSPSSSIFCRIENVLNLLDIELVT